MQADRPFIGILFMLAFCMLAPLGDALAKWLSVTVPVAILLVVRFGAQVLFLLPLVWLNGYTLRLSRRHLGLLALRALLHIGGLGCMFLALRQMPLADAIAIAFVMPFIMLLLGHFVLHETVGVHRFAACAVGFLGTLMVIQPSFAKLGAVALLPLAVAVFFSLFMLVTRQMAKDMHAIVMQTISGGFATVLLLPLLLLPPEVAYALPDLRFDLLLLLGAIGTLAHLFMTWSLRFAPSATLAPMQYIEIPITTVVGLIVFSEFPNGLALAGICVTMAAGLYIILRERRASRSAPPEPDHVAE
ncbi:membrane protein [Actibacterium mucosum KCTC 23349]|uniref:Membrane protein n=1 Tax=Actibacterium mucosum KCTC 23349 TaxID=1454373 RepID=A0A037ZCF1_9RHOB|nr:DMT family transporter [Actibacterium mucosum]KAJ54184.1 membrane protein [Actibacterium mucosum KCTC 23349]